MVSEKELDLLQKYVLFFWHRKNHKFFNNVAMKNITNLIDAVVEKIWCVYNPMVFKKSELNSHPDFLTHKKNS